MSAVESTGALYYLLVRRLRGFPGLPPSAFLGVFCLFFLASASTFFYWPTRGLLSWGSPLIFLSAYCSWLAIWSSHCFCRLVSSCLSILLSRTRSIPIFIPVTVKSISLVFPLWQPLHKGCIVYFVNCFACNSIICILCQPQLLLYFPYTIYVSLTEMH